MASIQQMLASTGLPEDVMRASQNTISARLKAHERDRFRAAADRAASRNIADSGLLERSIRDIRQETGETLASQLSDLGLESARHAAQMRAQGISGATAFASDFLNRQRLGLDAALAERGQDLGALSTAIGGMLGLG